jgi:hypothetical protein
VGIARHILCGEHEDVQAIHVQILERTTDMALH